MQYIPFAIPLPGGTVRKVNKTDKLGELISLYGQ